jgi:membrane protein required for beta-lactamase induction
MKGEVNEMAFLALVWIICGTINAKWAIPKLYGSVAWLSEHLAATFWLVLLGPIGFIFSAGDFWIGRTLERLIKEFLR